MVRVLALGKKGLDEILGNAFFPLFKSDWTVDSMEFLRNQ